MPENPEVYTIATQLHFYLCNRTLLKIEKTPRYTRLIENFDLFHKDLPLTIDKVISKGKLICIQFSNTRKDHTPWRIYSQLKMTGSWRLDLTEKESKYTMLILHLKVSENTYPLNIDKIYFTDVRKFADTYIEKSSYRMDRLAKSFLGEDKITLNEFTNNIKNYVRNCKDKQRTCKNIIHMLRDDQTTICSGIGNYLISEILYKFSTNIHTGWTALDKLNDDEIKRLYKSCCFIIDKSYKYGGMSMQNYVDVHGIKGTYSDHKLIYKKGKSKVYNGRKIWLRMHES
jgi:formamidopyrimidine-DNA glycosylase